MTLQCQDVNGFDEDAEQCTEDATCMQHASAVLNRPDLRDRETFVPEHATPTPRCDLHAREFAGMCARMYPGRSIERAALTVRT